MILFQILFTLFALLAAVNVVKRKKEGQINMTGAMFWTFFWLFGIVVVLRPESAALLANTLGIGRGSDLILYISVVIIFYLIFKLHIKLENINRNLTKIVRKEAVEEGADLRPKT